MIDQDIHPFLSFSVWPGLGCPPASIASALRRITFDWAGVRDSIINYSVKAQAVTGTATTAPARRIPLQKDA